MCLTERKRKIGTSLSFVLILMLNIISANAQQDTSGQLRLTRQEVINTKATGTTAPGSSNLSAVQVIVLHGDPSKAGLYTILLKVEAHTRIPAHLHPDDRMATVISGTWYFGYGDKFDERKLKMLPPGSIYSEVKDQNHFAMTGDEPVIAEITGYGPSGVTYVNAADDPKNKNHQ